MCNFKKYDVMKFPSFPLVGQTDSLTPNSNSHHWPLEQNHSVYPFGGRSLQMYLAGIGESILALKKITRFNTTVNFQHHSVDIHQEEGILYLSLFLKLSLVLYIL